MVVNFLEHLDRSHYRPSVCCFDVLGSLAGPLQEKGIDVQLLKRRPGVDLRYIFQLAGFLRKTETQILHLHNPTAFFYGTLAGKLARVPCIIYTEHGRDFSSSKKVKLANWLLAHMVDQLVTVADYGRRYLAEDEGIARDRIVTIHNGIDAGRFGASYDSKALRAGLGLADDQPVVGIVARLDPIKNHALLIRAMRQVTAELPGAKLLVVGDGPLRGELEALTRELDLGGHVQFLGARSDVPELLNLLDLFVLCSYSEGLSLTLIEASAAAKPIVATDVGGNGEVVEHGVNGLLVPSDDPKVLAAAILRILPDQVHRQSMGQAGRRRFEQQFTLKGMVRAYEELYSTCRPG